MNMVINMINQLSSILSNNDYRTLFTEYFASLQSEVPFVAAELYLFPRNEKKITTYRSIKGRLYEKSFSYNDIEGTLIEDIVIEKEEKRLLASELFNTKSLIKDSYYFDEGAKMLYVYPMIEVSKLNAVMVLLFEDEFEIDLTIELELLSAKISMLYAQDKVEKDKHNYKKILLNERIYPYQVTDINDELLNHHISTDYSKPKVIKNDGKYYELHKINDSEGYLKDISNEIDLRVNEAEAYKDKTTLFNTMNKLMKDIEELSQYSLIQIKFSNAYELDVSLTLRKLFKRGQLYRSNHSALVLFPSSDKRVLNKNLRLIKDSLKTIMTFEYQIGVIRYPVDVKTEVLSMLDAITDSDSEFYDKNLHMKIVNTLTEKKRIIQKIEKENYELKFHPIINTKNQLEGYYVSHDIDQMTFEDKRIELLIIQYTLRTIQKVGKKTRFFIDVSDELVKSQEFLNVLKDFRHFEGFFKPISFIFDCNDTTAEQYLIQKESKISRRSVEALYQKQKKANYLFQNIIYDNYSKEYIHFLSSIEDKGIIPVFEVESREELQYVVDYQIGFVYTKKAQDVLIVKG